MTKEIEDRINEAANKEDDNLDQFYVFKNGAKFVLDNPELMRDQFINLLNFLDAHIDKIPFNNTAEANVDLFINKTKAATMNLQQHALEVAITQIGQEEKPIGSNWGHPVQDYLASVDINFPASWCMAFLYWCFRKASLDLLIENPMIKSGGVLKEWDTNHFEYKIEPHSRLQPGDIFIQDHGGGLGHCGIIESIDGDTLHTIEANTNNNGSREGYAVERKTRPRTDPKIIGYLRYL